MAGAKRGHIYIAGSLNFCLFSFHAYKTDKAILAHVFQSENRDNGCEDMLKF